jgi:hypothetical protein
VSGMGGVGNAYLFLRLSSPFAITYEP